MLFIALPAFGQTPSVWVDDLTWPEVRDAIAAGKRMAIIYGQQRRIAPHMVIGKHNFIARFSERIAENWATHSLSQSACVAGNALTRTGHMRFPGTVTLTPEAPSASCAAWPGARSPQASRWWR
jgi:hypothetical protein